jgi:hypothetical protein
MGDAAWRWGGVLAAMSWLVTSLPAAEQAWRTDGRHVRGTLTLDKGRLRFTPAEGEAIPLADIARIRFADQTPPPFRAGGGRRVVLRDGQRITGQLLRLDKDTLTLRTAWAAKIALPRAAVASIDPLPGWRIVAEDDFRKEEKGLSHTLAKPLREGRFGVNFEEQGTVELLFQEGKQSRRIAVTVAGNGEHYTVDAGDRRGETRKVRRTPGWHRLIVQFSKRSLRITCDNDVLWYNLEQGPGGALKRVTIRCPSSPQGAARDAVAWTEFCLERAANEHPRPPIESEQDTIRLIGGDELFGRILQADRRVLHIEGKFGKRALPWPEVAGCTFRHPPAPPRAKGGANVRILVRSGLCPEFDVLHGVLTALDEKRLTLRHALLGDLTFERGRVREVQPFEG